MEFPQTGGCQCCELQYEITQPPTLVYTCHRIECKRMISV